MPITHRTIETNGIRMHLAEAGAGPLIVMCHGFPESWYFWRHQLGALAEAGYHVVAPDMRGYGQTDRPEAIDQYSIFHLVGDMVGLLDALKVEQAVIVGRDWGGPVAWHSALFRPDRFRAVAAMSVPFFPRTSTRPSSSAPASEHRIFYQTYFQKIGVAEQELEKDARRSIRETLYAWSGDVSDHSADALTMVPRDGGWLTGKNAPAAIPGWLTEDDIDFYVAEFSRSGFLGPLNWYRNIDRNWELMAPWSGATVRVPALFMVGEHDLLLKFRGVDRLLSNLKNLVPGLQEAVVLPGCGHWTQQERPQEVNAALLGFLGALRP